MSDLRQTGPGKARPSAPKGRCQPPKPESLQCPWRKSLPINLLNPRPHLAFVEPLPPLCFAMGKMNQIEEGLREFAQKHEQPGAWALGGCIGELEQLSIAELFCEWLPR